MNSWYLIKFTYHIRYSSCPEKNHFEEQVRLVQANGKNDALEKARFLAEREEEILVTSQGETIEWKLLAIHSLQECGEDTSIKPLYTKTINPADHSAYIHSLLHTTILSPIPAIEMS